MKMGSPGDRTGLSHIFEEGVRYKVWFDCHRYIPKSTEKKVFAAAKFCTLVNNLP